MHDNKTGLTRSYSVGGKIDGKIVKSRPGENWTQQPTNNSSAESLEICLSINSLIGGGNSPYHSSVSPSLNLMSSLSSPMSIFIPNILARLLSKAYWRYLEIHKTSSNTDARFTESSIGSFHPLNYLFHDLSIMLQRLWLSGQFL